ncbi:immunoglobulin G-binding protein A-like isoform X2 [Homalodisca vitripennis]|uniref:immunoglobulin G-binding protein A-like isoform X2 n=1 Tax=Homalodisca vitripennis TaxID=197043 RepID=UPI001EECCA66|nr:immunoglobulin G-binding protein A-like isoform X2 [Homalodisca vitripennis]
MMWSVLLFVTLCMVLMEVIPSSQLPAEDNEMFAFQDGQSGDGPPGKRDVSFDGQSGDGPPGKRDVRFDGQSGDGPPGKRDVSFEGQSGDGPPGKRDVSDEIVNDKSSLLHGEDCWPPSLCRRR